MERAAVVIGMKKTGSLEILPASHSSARKMEAWAQKQGLPKDRIKLILDDGLPVTIQRIREAIKELADTLVVEQLLIYFCGHGIYTRGSEFWLLSGAPDIPEEAVNLAASADLARQSVFKHVVFISDACRTAALGFQFQQVTGSSIFTNPATQPDEERSVDQFFACALNTPSKQTQDEGADGAPFRSMYTSTLIDALDGNFEEVVCSGQTDDHTSRRFVHPWPLKRLLRRQVPEEIRRAGLPLNAYQTPDARICSDPSAWISELSAEPTRPGVVGSVLNGVLDFLPPLGISSSFSSLTAVTNLGAMSGWGRKGKAAKRTARDLPEEPTDPAMTIALDEHEGMPLERLAQIPDAELSAVDREVREHAMRLMASDTAVPSQFESGMGFVVHGATLEGAVPIRQSGVSIAGSADAAVVESDRFHANVLLEFSNGRGTVLPAVAGFVTNLTFDGDHLVSVSYEPMDPMQRVDRHVRPDEQWRWMDARVVADRARENRALIASMCHAGIFRLDAGTSDAAENAEKLARRLQSSKTYDPSMAIYAAYAYYDLQRIDRIAAMAGFLVEERGLMLYDLALLTRSLLEQSPAPGVPRVAVVPFFPMLTRGWSLMASSAVALPLAMKDLERHVMESLWTVFDRSGVEMIRNSIRLLEDYDEALSFRPRESATGQGSGAAKR